MTKDFDLKFGYKNGFLADSEALCMCPCLFDFIFFNSNVFFEKIKELFINFHTFDFRPRYLAKYVHMGDFPPNDFFLECAEALHQISGSQVECKWKKGRFFEGQSFHILLKSDPILSIDQDLVHHHVKSSCRPRVERWSILRRIDHLSTRGRNLFLCCSLEMSVFSCLRTTQVEWSSGN